LTRPPQLAHSDKSLAAHHKALGNVIIIFQLDWPGSTKTEAFTAKQIEELLIDPDTQGQIVGTQRRWAALFAALVGGCSQTVGLVPQEAQSGQPIASPCNLPPGKKVPETSIHEIANALRGGDFKKGEFEKTTQFRARMSGRVAQAHQKIARIGYG